MNDKKELLDRSIQVMLYQSLTGYGIAVRWTTNGEYREVITGGPTIHDALQGAANAVKHMSGRLDCES